MKFQIKQLKDNDQTVVIEVLKGNTVIMTREFLVNLDFNLEEIKKQLLNDVELMDIKQKEEERRQSKVDDLKSKIGKKEDL